MPSSIYEERLAEHRHATLLPEVGLTRYTHIERLGNEEVEGLLDGECVIQNKIDGTNLTVAWYDEPIGLVIASRNNVVYRNGDFVKFPKKDKDGNPEIGLDGKPKIEIRYVDAVDYVRAHGGIQTLAAMGFILRGELRRVLVRRFPYALIYVVDRDGCLILAVMHLHRLPGYWRGRL